MRRLLLNNSRRSPVGRVAKSSAAAARDVGGRRSTVEETKESTGKEMQKEKDAPFPSSQDKEGRAEKDGESV